MYSLGENRCVVNAPIFCFGRSAASPPRTLGS
jgi:hypothetical protein